MVVFILLGCKCQNFSVMYLVKRSNGPEKRAFSANFNEIYTKKIVHYVNLNIFVILNDSGHLDRGVMKKSITGAAAGRSYISHTIQRYLYVQIKDKRHGALCT